MSDTPKYYILTPERITFSYDPRAHLGYLEQVYGKPYVTANTHNYPSRLVEDLQAGVAQLCQEVRDVLTRMQFLEHNAEFQDFQLAYYYHEVGQDGKIAVARTNGCVSLSHGETEEEATKV